MEGLGPVPQVRLAVGVDPESLGWPNLGYADAYGESFQIFQRLRAEGVLPAAARFQVQYPTPLAVVSAWVVPEDRDRVEASYERALFGDLDRLLAATPHGDVAVQWDVAAEFAYLELRFPGLGEVSFDAIVQRLARCVDQVPTDVPVGMHLCHGDMLHRHFKDPESLAVQVRVANAIDAAATRPVSWYAFTVPQNRRDAPFFAPLRDLRSSEPTELYLALVPYHPDKQEPGTTDDQVRLVDEYLARDEWGICTECGMANAEPEEIPGLLDKYREILAAYAS